MWRCGTSFSTRIAYGEEVRECMKQVEKERKILRLRKQQRRRVTWIKMCVHIALCWTAKYEKWIPWFSSQARSLPLATHSLICFSLWELQLLLAVVGMATGWEGTEQEVPKEYEGDWGIIMGCGWRLGEAGKRGRNAVWRKQLWAPELGRDNGWTHKAMSTLQTLHYPCTPSKMTFLINN